ncbi:MAG: hypothetical protein PWP08_315 [Methanofollis sp.]|nr:hypothetical protein [Methanofollis sp.]
MADQIETLHPGSTTGMRTLSLREAEYDRLLSIIAGGESFSDAIERLLDFYEAYASGVHSRDLADLKRELTLPESQVYRKVACTLLAQTLALGDNVSFTIGYDPLTPPLSRTGKGLITFYKDDRRFCLFRIGKDYLWLYFPTEREDTDLEGWELVQNVLLDNYLEEGGMWLIQKQYATL